MSAAICKKKKKYNHQDSTICLQIIVPWPQYRAETLIYQRGNQDTNTLGLATVWIEFQTTLDGKKPNWTKHSGEPYRATYTNSSAKWDALKNALVSRCSLLFWSYWPKLLQCFLESTSAVNISSQDHFLTAKTGKKISQLERSHHIVARQPWIPNQKKERFMTSKIVAVQPAYNDITLLSSIGMLSWLLLGKCRYQTNRRKELWPKPNDSAYDPRVFRATSHV